MSARSVFGVYRAIPSPELLAHVESTFVAVAPEAERDAVRAEALHELRGAELVLGEDGSFISRSGVQVFLRAELTPAVLAQPSFQVDKPSGQSVRIERLDANTLVASQDGRPPITFRRS